MRRFTGYDFFEDEGSHEKQQKEKFQWRLFDVLPLSVADE
jgi:hypothetical protein